MRTCIFAGDWRAGQASSAKEIPIKAVLQLGLLRRLTDDWKAKKYISGGEVGYLVSNIHDVLTFDGIPEGSSQNHYLNKQIENLRWRAEYSEKHPESSPLDNRAVRYVKRVIGLMEKVRDSGISLPSFAPRVW